MKRMKEIIRISIVIIILCITIMLTQSAECATPIQYMGIIELMENDTPKMGYAIGTPGTGEASKIWNIVKYDSETSSTYKNQNIYCVKAGVGFTQIDNGTIKRAPYDVSYDMKTQRDNIKAQNNILKELVEGNITEGGITISRYNAILAVLDMLYLPGESTEEEKTELINTILQCAMYDNDYKATYSSYVELMQAYPLTEDDINAVQQAVLWYFTNYGEGDEKYDKTSNSGWLNYTLDGANYKPLPNYKPNGLPEQYDAGQARSYQAEILYQYMIRQAKEKANQYTNSSSTAETPAKLDTTTLNYKAEGNNYIIGPIHMTETEGNITDYTVDFIVKNNNTQINNYTLLDKNLASVKNGTKVKDLVGEDFYISVPKSSAQSITINITVKYKNKKATLWASSTNNQEQPLVIPETEDISIPAELRVDPKGLDLALRKYITKRNTNELTGANVRVPNIDESTLRTGTTATYKHKKDPVAVVTGDKVTYKMTIYNEGEKVGRATKVVDQLPTGLKFVRVVSGNFELGSYDETKNILNLVRKSSNTSNLVAYTTGSLISGSGAETIEIECQVTAVAGASDQILTNVAWIAEQIDGVTNETITTQVGKDRDSEPGTAPNVNKDSMANYTGNGNPTDLTNANYYYKGQQDDDDFEKLIIKKAEGNYNLQIIKVDSQDSNIKLSGATFKVTLADGTVKTLTTDSEGTINISGINILQTGTDTITIEETQVPEGYFKLLGGTLNLQVTKEMVNGSYQATNVSISNGGIDGTNASITNGVVQVTVPNKKLKGNYQLQLVKVDFQDTNIKLSGATFKITLADGTVKTLTTDVQGILTIPVIDITQAGIDTITIEETQVPEGYLKLVDKLTIQVTKSIVGQGYQATDIAITSGGITGTSVGIVDNVVKVTVPNKKLEGRYDLQIVKVDLANPDLKLEGAVFKVTLADGTVKTLTTDNQGILTIPEINITQIGTENLMIEEIQAPKRYEKLEGILTLEVTKEIVGEKYQATNIRMTTGDTTEGDVTLENGKIQLTVKDQLLPVDFKLVKRIVSVNAQEVPERIEGIDVSKLNTLDDDGNLITTADYKLNKEPVEVKRGDIVTYALRVYNEGMIDGYVQEITEDVPEGLQFLWSEKEGEELKTDTTLTDEEKEAIAFNQQYLWGKFIYDDTKENIIQISSDYLSKENEATVKGNLITAFGDNDGTKTESDLAYKEIFVKFKVISDNIAGTIIRNESAITEDCDEDGEPSDDRDSETDKWIKYEDDEDYDNIILRSFDLALRKFIIAVSGDTKIENHEYLKNEDGSYMRAPIVDTSKLNTLDEEEELITTAIYNHTKRSLLVKRNDIIIYMLRVYNEGDINGYASEIKDHLPPYLEFIEDEFNKQYGWEVSEDGRTVTTRYLENSLIEKAQADENGEIVLSYKEVPIMCKVSKEAKTNENITNIADITEYLDETKRPAIDRDSEEDNVELPNDKDLPNYKEDEMGNYVPGQQDDDDFEKLVVEIFDLALRKFITQVEDKPVDTRLPKIKYDKENNQISYEHTKEPVNVVTGNIVIYTIRIFNEGQKDGYAAQILDDIPDGLEFLPENENNKIYRWKMYRQLKEGETVEETKTSIVQDGVTFVETAKVEEAEVIVTDYLSKEQGEARTKEEEETENPNLLKAFNPNEEISEKNPDYKDVKVAFRVIEPNTSDKIIVNAAQISEDTDENGEPIDDEDSVPGEWNEGEDDQDKEYIKLNYFDLALRKWVTEAIVVENGKQDVTKTGHDAWDDPEAVVKVELSRKKLNQVMVKFKYSIRVYNQGDIEGYAKEITDYVPQGLKFVAGDNPGWKDEGNNVISTRLLENKLLQPGENADVEVILTWINNADNMGVMNNVAEISEDYNEYGALDIDSTPDNQKKGEDDIDDAPVMLSISTGQVRIYFTLGFIVLITIASGVILIKKFVL